MPPELSLAAAVRFLRLQGTVISLALLVVYHFLRRYRWRRWRRWRHWCRRGFRG